MRTRLVRPQLAVALFVLSIGCGATIMGDDPDTGLAITVLKSPIQPVVCEGETNSAPVEGASVRVVGLTEGGRVERTTDGGGEARMALLPGRYRVEVSECPGARVLPDVEEADVREGELTPVLLMCDTGIR